MHFVPLRAPPSFHLRKSSGHCQPRLCSPQCQPGTVRGATSKGPSRLEPFAIGREPNGATLGRYELRVGEHLESFRSTSRRPVCPGTPTGRRKGRWEPRRSRGRPIRSTTGLGERSRASKGGSVPFFDARSYVASDRSGLVEMGSHCDCDGSIPGLVKN